MARRATYITEKTSPLQHRLVLDSGDFVGGSRPLDEIKAKSLLKGMVLAGYDAVNLGERDFLLGPQFLMDMKKEHNIPFVSANVYHTDSTTLFTDPYIIKKFKGKESDGKKTEGIKVGIFGLMLLRPHLVYNKLEPKLIVKDPFEVAEAVVSKLSGKCDIIIALAHLPSNQMHDLKNRVKGIDILIGGHSFSRVQGPFAPEQALLLEAGSKGQFVGDLLLQLDENKKIISGEGENILLDEDIQKDVRYEALQKAYDQEYANHFRLQREERARKQKAAQTQD